MKKLLKKRTWSMLLTARTAAIVGVVAASLPPSSDAGPPYFSDWDETPCLKQAEGDAKKAYDACKNDACRGWADGDYKRHLIQLCHDEKVKEQAKIDAYRVEHPVSKPKYQHTCTCVDPTGRQYAHGANSCAECCPATKFQGCSTR
ncbi:hypothetical protein D7Y23_37065 [Corallococcus sp. AB050B]|nr:hypothetical protein D7Y23_37065 [Corallococcus sp. AB050B]